MNASKVDKKTYYRGVRMIPYDLLKEVTIAMVGVLGVVLILSAVLSSPDVPSVTLQSWSKADPVDFLTTASGELAGSTVSLRYGPPYNSGTGSRAELGAAGSRSSGRECTFRSTLRNDFVLEPLTQATAGRCETRIGVEHIQGRIERSAAEMARELHDRHWARRRSPRTAL